MNDLTHTLSKASLKKGWVMLEIGVYQLGTGP